MQPIFTLQYGEYAVANYLSQNIKGISVFVPTSAQEKGIDLLLYKFNSFNKCTTIQVKTSKVYQNSKDKYFGHLWFNNFGLNKNIPINADWFILNGICFVMNNSVNKYEYKEVFLAFTNKEMKKFISEVKLKSKNIPDKFFGFSYDLDGKIYQTRGYKEKRNMSKYLIENRLKDIQKSVQ